METFTIAVDQPTRSEAVIPALLRFVEPLQTRPHLLSIVPSAEESGRRHEEMSHLFPDSDIEIAVEVETSATAHLLGVASDYPERLLALHTHARGAVGESIFGSIACHILRQSHVPLIFAGPGFDSNAVEELSRVIVCLDGSEAAETMVDHAAEFASAADASLWFIQVLRGDVVDSRHESGYVARTAKAAEKKWNIDTTWEVLHGADIGTVIADYVRGDGGTLLAMTTHGRSGIGELVAGSVAQTVVRHADCPVMVMKP